MDASKKLYVMISKTDTGIGSVIRKVTGFPYNHVSMTLDESFRTWVSFARFIQDAPLYGGFIVEPAERFLAKGKTVDVHIFAVDITPQRYEELRDLFSKAGNPDSGYIYNHFELVTLTFGIKFPIHSAYTCLGFANAVMGTNYASIRDLDRQMASMLYYEGTLNDLAPDSGDRSDIYFTRLGLRQGTLKSIHAIGQLIHRATTKRKDQSISPAAVK